MTPLRSILWRKVTASVPKWLQSHEIKSYLEPAEVGTSFYHLRFELKHQFGDCKRCDRLRRKLLQQP